GGGKGTLRQVAELPDAATFGPGVATGGAFTAEDVRRKYAALDAHLAAVGRSKDAVLRTYFAFVGNVGDDVPPGERRGRSAAGLEDPLLGGPPAALPPPSPRPIPAAA